jgi:hypothetical protein
MKLLPILLGIAGIALISKKIYTDLTGITVTFLKLDLKGLQRIGTNIVIPVIMVLDNTTNANVPINSITGNIISLTTNKVIGKIENNGFVALANKPTQIPIKTYLDISKLGLDAVTLFANRALPSLEIEYTINTALGSFSGKQTLSFA